MITVYIQNTQESGRFWTSGWRGHTRGSLEVLTGQCQLSDIRKVSCVSLRTAAGSSDTWGYTWRSHNSDCAHQGHNGHWVSKIWVAVFWKELSLTNIAGCFFPLLHSVNNGDNLKLRPSLSFTLLPFFIKTSLFLLSFYFAYGFWILFLAFASSSQVFLKFVWNF
jgi:hypothetical protein